MEGSSGSGMRHPTVYDMLLESPAYEALSYMDIKVITDEDACDEVVAEILWRTNHQAVGFDCEWVTRNGRQPVALLQLSTYDGLCALFRLCRMKTIPRSLKDLLGDEEIYKVGIAPDSDGRKLLKDYSLTVKSTLDLRHLAEMCGNPPRGLEKLSKSVLNITLNKDPTISTSNWEQNTLSEEQLFYAAADAHVSIKVFAQLISKYGENSQFTELYGDEDVWSKLDEVCGKYLNLHFFDPLSLIFGKRNELRNILIRGLNKEKDENLPARVQTLINNTLNMDLSATDIKTLRLKSGDVVAGFKEINTKYQILYEASKFVDNIKVYRFLTKKTISDMKTKKQNRNNAARR